MKKLHLLLLVPAFLLMFCTAQAEDATGDVSIETINSGPAPKGLPSQAAWGYWKAAPTAWIMTHNGMIAQTKKGGGEIVFLGDSITAGWSKGGKAIWEQTYAPLKAVNYGIGGDTTRQVIWRIEHGELDGFTPKLVVLMIGTNNLYADQNSGTNEEIADGVKKIIELIQAKSPTTKILLLGVLPRQTKVPWCDRIAALNLLLAPLANGSTVRYLDIDKDFLDSEDKAKAELFNTDLVHPNAKGYEVISAAVLPTVTEMVK